MVTRSVVLARLFLGGALLCAPVHAVLWPNEIARIEGQLASGETATRRQAAERLRQLPRPTAERLVRQSLKDLDAHVRLAAAYAAIELRIEGVGALVVPWLVEADKTLRLAAVRVLQVSPAAEGAAALGRALADPDARVREGAARALAMLTSEESSTALLSHLDDAAPAVRIAVIEGLAKRREVRAVVPLIGKSQDRDSQIRSAAARALATLGDARAAPALTLLLRDSDRSVRTEAVHALGALKEHSSVATIAVLLKEDPDPQVRTAAADALATIGSEAAIETLLDSLTAASRGSVPAVRAALGRLGATAAPQLERCLEQSSDTGQLAVCAELLAVTKTPTAVPALVGALASGRLDKRLALHAVGQSGDTRGLGLALEHLSDASPSVRKSAIAATRSLLDQAAVDGRAVEPLIAALRAPQRAEEETLALIELLGQTGSRRAVPALIELLSGKPRTQVRTACLAALGHLGNAGQSASKVLLQALDADDQDVRQTAARALARTRDPKSGFALLGHFQKAKKVEREVLASALGGALTNSDDTRLFAALGRTLLRAKAVERDQLIEALGHANKGLATSLLLRLSRALPVVADQAKLAEALAGREEARPTLLKLLESGSARVRANASWALRNIATREDLPALIEALEDRSVAVVANTAIALGHVLSQPGAGAAATLCPLLDHPHPYVRVNALAGLRTSSASCEIEGLVRRLRSDGSALVRQSVARHLHRRSDEDAARRALEDCARDDLDFDVARACRDKPEPPPSGSEVATVLVIPSQAADPLPLRSFALLHEDGSLRLGTSDRRGAVFDRTAPRGSLSLVVPAPLVP